MKTITIKDDQKLSDVKDAFNAKFPHLKIEFYKGSHEENEGSGKKELLDDSLYLRDIRSNHAEGELSVDGHLKTSSFEQNFMDHYGVNVQVFRKSGNLWLQTIATDNWTLAEQEKEAQAFER